MARTTASSTPSMMTSARSSRAARATIGASADRSGHTPKKGALGNSRAHATATQTSSVPAPRSMSAASTSALRNAAANSLAVRANDESSLAARERCARQRTHPVARRIDRDTRDGHASQRCGGPSRPRLRPPGAADPAGSSAHRLPAPGCERLIRCRRPVRQSASRMPGRARLSRLRTTTARAPPRRAAIRTPEMPSASCGVVSAEPPGWTTIR